MVRIRTRFQTSFIRITAADQSGLWKCCDASDISVALELWEICRRQYDPLKMTSLSYWRINLRILPPGWWQTQSAVVAGQEVEPVGGSGREGYPPVGGLPRVEFMKPSVNQRQGGLSLSQRTKIGSSRREATGACENQCLRMKNVKDCAKRDVHLWRLVSSSDE